MLHRIIHHATSRSLALFVVLSFAAEQAAAQAALYHSAANDGVVPAATPVLPTPGPEWLHLYADTAGSSVTTSGTVCEDGDGDEICGFYVSLQAGSGAELLSFTPASDVYYSLTATALSATGVGATTVGVDPVWIGDLLVQSTDPTSESQIEGTGLHVVTADLSVQPVGLSTVATIPVPEPGHAVCLAAGAALLLCLGRARNPLGRERETRDTGFVR